MPAEFHLTRTTALPRLAWCARITKGAPEVIVDAGTYVEGDACFFVESAWSGDFDLREFPEALTFCGTGGVIRGDEIIFCTPTHSLQALYLLRQRDTVTVSNSLVFLLQRCGDDIDLRYMSYDLDLMSIMFGVTEYTKHVPTRAGNRAHLFYNCNLRVTSDLQLREQPKQEPASFEDFQAYRDFLQQQVVAVIGNAVDDRRKVRYKPLATVSSGYDSSACAVLGRAAGCTEAVTLNTARSGESDSGRPIGELLGLTVSEFDSKAFLQRTDQAEAEFHATGYGGDDCVMIPLEGVLPARLLLTGYLGDKMWNRHSKVGPHMARGDPGGASLNEFRLRVGFLNLPVPFIGCTRHASIIRITNSDAMRQWSVPNVYYDRPIPRRILEEAGIPRHLFGQSKKAVAQPYQTTGNNNPDLSQVLPPASLQAFRRFAEGKPLFESRLERIGFALLRALYRFNLRALQSVKLNALARTLGLKLPARPYVGWKYSKPRTEHSLVFHWAHSLISTRYRNPSSAEHDSPHQVKTASPPKGDGDAELGSNASSSTHRMR